MEVTINFDIQKQDGVCPDALWSFFKTVVHTTISRFVPLRAKRVNKYNPWITREILRLKRKINRVRRNRKSTSSILGVLRNQLRTMIKHSRFHFFNVTMLSFLKDNPQKFWPYLSKKSESVKTVEHNDHIVEDDEVIANLFIRLFSSVSTNDNSQLPLYSERNFRVPDVVVSKEGIFEHLLRLNNKKSCGPDAIQNMFLGRYGEWCSEYLYVIYTHSCNTGVVPSDWKNSRVVPIHKSGSTMEVRNYRPVSSLCCSGKVIEHFLCNHLTAFLEKTTFSASSNTALGEAYLQSRSFCIQSTIWRVY